MKKYITSSLFIFWALTVAVLVAGLIYFNKGSSTNAPAANLAKGQNGVAITGVDTAATKIVLSQAELAKHNSASSCWLLISGKIYDVTSYIKKHPGGRGEILATCGTDATAAYDSRGGTGSHSSSAKSQLTAYYIGNLNQSVNTVTANQTAP